MISRLGRGFEDDPVALAFEQLDGPAGNACRVPAVELVGTQVLVDPTFRTSRPEYAARQRSGRSSALLTVPSSPYQHEHFGRRAQRIKNPSQEHIAYFVISRPPVQVPPAGFGVRQHLRVGSPSRVPNRLREGLQMVASLAPWISHDDRVDLAASVCAGMGGGYVRKPHSIWSGCKPELCLKNLAHRLARLSPSNPRVGGSPHNSRNLLTSKHLESAGVSFLSALVFHAVWELEAGGFLLQLRGG